MRTSKFGDGLEKKSLQEVPPQQILRKNQDEQVDKEAIFYLMEITVDFTNQLPINKVVDNEESQRFFFFFVFNNEISEKIY